MGQVATPPPSGRWVEIRCTQPACLKACPGGRILFRQKLGTGMYSIKRRKQGAIFIGVPVVAVCRCGWIWRNADLASVLDLGHDIEELREGA